MLIPVLSIVFVAFLLVLSTHTVEAATIEVGSGCSLKQAIHAAKGDKAIAKCAAGSGADTIVLSGNINLTQQLPGIKSSDITIEGNGYRISGSNQHRIFVVKSGELTLRNVELRNGYHSNTSGAILIMGGRVKIEDSVITHNNAGKKGGAIWMNGATLWIDDSVIASNKSGTNGGAVWAKDSTVTIRNTSITGNGTTFKGGAIFTKGNTNLTLQDVNFQNNSARKGNDVWRQ